MEWIFHFGAPFDRLHGGRRERQPRSFLVGQMTRALVVAPTGAIATMGIRFRPGMIGTFLPAGGRDALPIPALTDRAVPAVRVWGADAAQLEARLDAAGRVGNPEVVEFLRASHAAAWLMNRRDEGPSALVTAMLDDILATRGSAAIGSICARIGVSRRHAERSFRAAVGVAPKMFSRVIRFQSVFSRAAEAAVRGWADVAHECGYFDQAHLIRDFQRFADVSPRRFLATQAALSRRFTDPERIARMLAPATSHSSKNPSRSES